MAAGWSNTPLHCPSLSFFFFSFCSVEHDFRLQEGQVVRTWKVGDPPEGSPQPSTPQATTPHQQDSPQAVRPPATTKKNRKKCFWFLWASRGRSKRHFDTVMHCITFFKKNKTKKQKTNYKCLTMVVSLKSVHQTWRIKIQPQSCGRRKLQRWWF